MYSEMLIEMLFSLSSIWLNHWELYELNLHHFLWAIVWVELFDCRCWRSWHSDFAIFECGLADHTKCRWECGRLHWRRGRKNGGYQLQRWQKSATIQASHSQLNSRVPATMKVSRLSTNQFSFGTFSPFATSCTKSTPEWSRLEQTRCCWWSNKEMSGLCNSTENSSRHCSQK